MRVPRARVVMQTNMALIKNESKHLRTAAADTLTHAKERCPDPGSQQRAPETAIRTWCPNPGSHQIALAVKPKQYLSYSLKRLVKKPATLGALCRALRSVGSERRGFPAFPEAFPLLHVVPSERVWLEFRALHWLAESGRLPLPSLQWESTWTVLRPGSHSSCLHDVLVGKLTADLLSVVVHFVSSHAVLAPSFNCNSLG